MQPGFDDRTTATVWRQGGCSSITPLCRTNTRGEEIDHSTTAAAEVRPHALMLVCTYRLHCSDFSATIVARAAIPHYSSDLPSAQFSQPRPRKSCVVNIVTDVG